MILLLIKSFALVFSILYIIPEFEKRTQITMLMWSLIFQLIGILFYPSLFSILVTLFSVVLLLTELINEKYGKTR
jgi:hypothetical protein